MESEKMEKEESESVSHMVKASIMAMASILKDENPDHALEALDIRSFPETTANPINCAVELLNPSVYKYISFWISVWKVNIIILLQISAWADCCNSNAFVKSISGMKKREVKDLE